MNPAKIKKTEMLRVPMTPVEFEAVNQLALKEGLMTNDFVRDVFRGIARKKGIWPVRGGREKTT